MEELKTGVQYGDMIGEIALDFFSNPLLLHDFAKQINIDKNYFPIALSIYQEKNTFIYLYACEISFYGDNIDQIRITGLKNREIITKKFELHISIEDLLNKIKRTSIVVKDRSLENISIKYIDE